MDQDAETAAIGGEAPGNLGSQTLLDVVQDLVVTGLIADQQQPQPVLLHDLQGVTRDVGLGVARPDNSELANLARQLFDTRQVVGQRIVVEKELLDLRKGLFGP